MRLALGISMAMHGYGKVVPHGALNHHAHYIVSLGLPLWLGYVSAYTEFVGGLLLIIGLLTRFAAAMIAINMLVALFLVGIHQGFGTYNYISRPRRPGYHADVLRCRRSRVRSQNRLLLSPK